MPNKALSTSKILCRLKVKCRLLPDPFFSVQCQQEAFSRDCVNIRERAENEPASCKAAQHIAEKENAATSAKVSGVQKTYEAAQLPEHDSPTWASAPAIIRPYVSNAPRP